MAPAVAKRGPAAGGDLFAHRGAAGKRRSMARTDRDGDLTMDAGPRNKENRVGKSRGRNTNGNSNNAATNGRLPVSSQTAKSAILRHITSDNVNMKQTKPQTSSSRHLKEIRITDWKNSKASTNSDGGVASLVTFLEKKVNSIQAKKNGALPSRKSAITKLQKHRVEGDTLIISAPVEVIQCLERMNNWTWAGVNLKIEGASRRSNSPPTKQTEQSAQTQIRPILLDFIQRRYNPDMKLLDLSAMASDPQLNEHGVYTSSTKPSNFFPALMKLCDEQFKSGQEKRETVQSVTLANNELVNLTPVTVLAQTFPDLKNLDLSNNKFATLSSIISWKHKFRGLEQILLNENPLLEQNPDYHVQIKNWYPALRLINGVQVRSDEEILRSVQGQKKLLPTRAPVFYDENQIAENFLRNFFAGYDTDRPAMINMYYDAKSTFSFSVNTHALRDPLQQQKMEPQEWEAYIKKSRNLKHLNHLPARVNRQYTGPASILEVVSSLPITRHPDLATEGPKWCIECQSLSGVPDITGQFPGGVGGFIITLHGEFEELDSTTGQPKKQRSFDRTFIIGPGINPGVPVRIVSDVLNIRAYGGFAAWKPDEIAGNMDQETLIAEVCRITGMVKDYSKQCLEESGWNLNEALARFESVKAMIPAEAFAQAI